MRYHKLIHVRFLFVLFCYLLIPKEVWAQHFTTSKSEEGIEILENDFRAGLGRARESQEERDSGFPSIHCSNQ